MAVSWKSNSNCCWSCFDAFVALAVEVVAAFTAVVAVTFATAALAAVAAVAFAVAALAGAAGTNCHCSFTAAFALSATALMKLLLWLMTGLPGRIFFPRSNLAKIQGEAVWNDETQRWRIPELVMQKTKLPPASEFLQDIRTWKKIASKNLAKGFFL